MLMASTPNAPRGCCVELQCMPHEVNIRHRGEDWAGITNQKERKKLQNRLNKRVSRQRKKRNFFDNVSSNVTSAPSLPRHATIASPVDNLIATFSYCTKESVAQNRAILKRFTEQALTSYLTADPCADHRLKIIQLNTINGFTRNATALGFNFEWLICECISPFGRDGQSSAPDAALTASAPSSLMPTSLQLRMRHHPWVDLFPLPRMRDNLLLATSIMTAEDEQRLYDDVMEAGGGRNEWAGLVVWGEPWDPQNWEISSPLLHKWGWLIRGCPEIIVSTNYWRSRRGEKPIACPSFDQRQEEYTSKEI